MQRDRDVERQRETRRETSKRLSKEDVRQASSAAPGAPAPPSCPAGAPPGPSSQVPTALEPQPEKSGMGQNLYSRVVRGQTAERTGRTRSECGGQKYPGHPPDLGMQVSERP